MNPILVCGAGGFIGSHLVYRLKSDGFWVRGVDLKYPEFGESLADEFIIADLRDQSVCRDVIDRPFAEVYQLAADMGGAGYLFSGDNDAEVMHNSAMINLNMVKECSRAGVQKLFYASSACVYPEYNQIDPNNPNCAEESVYPAEPDSEYGWEKLFSERLYCAFNRNHELVVYIGRFHNIFGPLCNWIGGREKVPAAICRKVAEAEDNVEIEIWGDGHQTRSFLYIEECLEAMRRLINSNFYGPVNIGSTEMISINELAMLIAEIAGKQIKIKNISGPIGVRGRNSDNDLIRSKLGWAPSERLRRGLERTYPWILEQVIARRAAQKLDEVQHCIES